MSFNFEKLARVGVSQSNSSALWMYQAEDIETEEIETIDNIRAHAEVTNFFNDAYTVLRVRDFILLWTPLVVALLRVVSVGVNRVDVEVAFSNEANANLIIEQGVAIETTTGASRVEVFRFTPPLESTIRVQTETIATRLDDTDQGYINKRVAMYVGGAIVGGVTEDYRKGPGNIDSRIVDDSPDIFLDVKGKNNQDWRFHVSYKIEAFEL